MSCRCLACLPLLPLVTEPCSRPLPPPDFYGCTRHEALAFPSPDPKIPPPHLQHTRFQNLFPILILPTFCTYQSRYIPHQFFNVCYVVGQWGNIVNWLLDFPLHRDHCGSNHPITGSSFHYLSVINPQRQRSDDPAFPHIYYEPGGTTKLPHTQKFIRPSSANFNIMTAHEVVHHH